MSDILVTSPYRPFTLPNQFKAVFNGFIYCGTVDAVDPSVSLVQVYLVNESGDKVPVSQPLRTNAGGFLVYNGQPAKFVTDSNHSLLVRDALGSNVWYAPDMASVDPQSLIEELAGPNGVDLVGGAASNEDLLATNGRVDQVESDISKINQLAANGFKCAAHIAKQIYDGSAPIFSCYGDSTMWGATVGNLGAQSPQNPPASLAVALNLVYGGDYTCPNRGISGSTLRGMMSGTDGSGSTFETKISTGGVDASAAVIICNHGINDSQLNLDIFQYKKDLEEFIRLCRVNGKVPVLATPNPNPQNVTAIIDEAKAKRLLDYVNVMRSVAKQTACDLVDQYAFFIASTNVISINNIVTDGAHLSHDGYRQAGFNLAIPFVCAHVIGAPKSQCGLENTTYFDNMTVGRKVQYQGARTGATFSGQKGPVLQGINYPVIFDRGIDVFSTMCLEYADAAKIKVNVNTTTGGEIYPAKEYGNQYALDWDSERKITKKCFAGLNIISYLLDPDDYGGLGVTLSFAGLRIPDRDIVSTTGIVAGDYYAKEFFSVGDTLSVSALFLDGSSLMITDRSDSAVVRVSLTGNTMIAELFKNNVAIDTKTIGTSITNGYYDMVFTLTSSQLIVNFGVLNVTFTLATPLVNCKVYSANTRFTLINR